MILSGKDNNTGSFYDFFLWQFVGLTGSFSKFDQRLAPTTPIQLK